MMQHDHHINAKKGIEDLKEIVIQILDPDFQLGNNDLKSILSIIVNVGVRKKFYPESIPRSEWLSMCLGAICVLLEKDPMVLIQVGPFDEQEINKGVTVDGEDENDTTLESTLTLSDGNYLYKWLIRALIPVLATTDEEILINLRGVFNTIIMLIFMNPRLFRCKLEIRRYLLSVFDTYSNNMMRKTNETKFTISMMVTTTSLFYLLSDSEIRKRLMLDSSYDSIFESAVRKMGFLVVSLIPDLTQVQIMEIDDILAKLLSYSLNYFINDGVRTISKLNFVLEVLRDILMNTSPLLSGHKTQVTAAYVLLQTFKECTSQKQHMHFLNMLEFRSCRDIVLKGKFHNLLLKSIIFINQYVDQDQNEMEPLGDAEFDQIINSIINQSKTLTKTNVFKSLLYIADQYQSIEITSYKQYIVTIQSKLSMFPSLTRFEKYSIINSIGDLYCIVSNSMDLQTRTCDICCLSTKDYSFIDTKRPEIVEPTLINSFIEYFILDGQRTTKKRDISGFDEENFDIILEISKLLTIYKIFSHYQPLKNFSKCPIFKYIARCFFSTNREIRLLALRILPLYIKSNENIKEENQVMRKIFAILEYKDLKDPHNSIYIESTVMGWSTLAVVSSGEIIRPILLKMIDSLASCNKVESTFAFHELQMVALAKKKTPWQLLSMTIDYWSKLIAQQLHNKPLFGQKISSLVGLSVDTILSHAATHIIPKMVMFYQNDVIGRIANIQGKKTKSELIMNNFSKVLAELITTIKNIDERVLVNTLKIPCPQLDKQVLIESMSPNLTIWEILMKYSPGPSDNKDLILKSIIFVLQLTNHSCLQDSKSPTESISKFFQNNILALIQNFSEVIRNTRGMQSYNEKVSSLNAVQFIIEFSPMSIVSALPQICTSLQTTLDNEPLSEKTLVTWKILVEYLPETHLISIIDQTIAFIIQKWSALDWRCRDISSTIINMLFDKSENFRNKNIYTFYSIAENDELVLIYQKVDSVIQNLSMPSLHLRNIDRRCSNDNKVVVKQALVDLKRFWKKYGDWIYKSDLKQPKLRTEVSKIYITLLHILHKFKTNDDICWQCCQLLGTIGAIDQTISEIQTKQRQKQENLIIVSDFENRRETTKFVIKFLDKHLVPSFWASDDPKKQLFLAFAMQEYLSVIDISNIDIDCLDLSSREAVLWNQFSDISRSTLTPLISSRFIARSGNYSPLSYPIFNTGKDHSKWIREFAFDLLKRVNDDIPGAKIYELCSSLAKDEDSIASFILPYISLSLLINFEPSNEIHENFQKEIITILSTDITTIHHSGTENFKIILESVFDILDYFKKWVYSRTAQLKKTGTSSSSNHLQTKTQIIKSFLSKIPIHLMAQRSIQSDSHARAIFYMEQIYKENGSETLSTSFTALESLQQTYANIGDYDALNGILKKFPTKSLDGRITQMEYNENWKMAQDCFEALSQFDTTGTANGITESTVIDPEIRLLKSLVDHNLYDQCLNKLNLLVNEKNKRSSSSSESFKKEWMDIGLQASIFAGNLDCVEFWCKQLELNDSLANSSNLLNYHIGKILIYFKNSDRKRLKISFENVYLLLAGSLGLNRSKSFTKNNNSLIALHAISEIEEILKNSDDYTNNNGNFHTLRTTMNLRLDYTAMEFKPHWNLLILRKTINGLIDTKASQSDTEDIWYRLAKLARKNNRTDLASSSVMRVVGTGVGDLEYAKLLWAQGDHSNAISEIKELLDEVKIDRQTQPQTIVANKKNIRVRMSDREKAKIQLKYTNWLEFTNSSSSSTIIEEYRAATVMDKTWDKAHFELGSYYSRLLELRNSEEANQSSDISGALELKTIVSFLRCLSFGRSYLFEAMPKIIVIWLNFADAVNNVDNLSKSTKDKKKTDARASAIVGQRREYLGRIITEIIKYKSHFPTYYWYTVLSELLSRITNSNKQSVELLIKICADIVSTFPSHALWSVLAQTNSKSDIRRQESSKIISMVSDMSLSSSQLLFSQLLKLCQFNLPKDSRKLRAFTSLSHHYGLNFKDCMPCSSLVIPIKTNFDITLNTSPVRSLKQFPNTSNVTWAQVEDHVDVLASLQAPKRLYIVGSDGFHYGILCKKDDLRKDAKIMEITTLLRYHLDKDMESSKRHLNILTYSVIPMQEEYGVIEWVNNSTTLRSAIMPKYHAIGTNIDFKKLAFDFDHRKNTKEELLVNFQNWKSHFPPVLYQWFIDNFTDPSSWYDARDNFTRSIAVMSMVGYILGLGDRHSENILLIETDGSVLHVDFDCVFEKGLSLGIPETVPFRLTNNIVDAFGIIGVEGKFRKSCEVTLGLLRKNQNSVISYLQNFFNDERSKLKKEYKEGTTKTDPMTVIKRKLRGILEKEGTAISVEGQVDFLIQISTSDEQLSQMYHGWLPFI